MAKQFRTVVIGRTGRGNYGHGLDVAAATHPRFQVVAVADDDAAGLGKAGERLNVKPRYLDWREMLRREKPEAAVIAMRWIDCHEEMALAAIEAGCHLFMEKPIAPTLAACDRIVDLSDRTHRRIVVAHNMRCCPILDHVQQRLAGGVIGDLLELRARGKEDRRAGGEDMMVLGTHLFDMMRRFAGDPAWVFGRVLVNGRDLQRGDVRVDGPEGMGPIAGDDITAVYGFASGLTGYFASRASNDTSGQRWGLDLVGTKGTLRIRAGHVPEIWVSSSRPDQDPVWRRLDLPGGIRPTSQAEANHLLLDDLAAAIDNNREPEAGARTARWTIEMTHGVYASQRSGGRVRLPLERRSHPLSA
jgi:predicted dehydrogenase